MKSSEMKSILQTTKALADRQRIRMLLLLQGRELCVCQIIAVIALAPSTISKHLSILSSAGLVEHRKEGRWAYYRLPGRSGDRTVQAALQWICNSLERDELVARDIKRLKEVLQCDPETLCRQQKKC